MADGVVRLGMPYDQRPDMRDLGQMLTEYCTQWKDIGAQLGLSSALLRVIDADNTKQRECFRETLQKWLQMDTKATWHKLELAITNATRGSGALPKLSSMQEVPPSQPPQQTEVPNNHLEVNLKREPEMRDLNSIVRPKILENWKEVAYALRYKLECVDAIEAKYQDPKKQCQELFVDWLKTDHGARAGPKTWATLLDAINQVEELTKAREEIQKELAKLDLA
ncbi:uncharacterized protein [Dysidea avara]|uniref:uncharacterized protein isoform X2 n=1 Tax=Dysidea avara TaxID=196820 RepID=UPI0033250292